MHLARCGRSTRESAPPRLEVAGCGAAHENGAGAGGHGLGKGAVDDAGGNDVVGEVSDGGAGEGVGCCVGCLGVRKLVGGCGKGGDVGDLRY